MTKQFIRLGCGIDVSKDRLAVCFGGYTTAGGFTILASRNTFLNSVPHIRRLIAWMAKLHAKYTAHEQLTFQVVLETTGAYHERVLHAIYEAGFTVCLERAAKVKKYLLSLGQYSKNDDLDAGGLCRLACERQLRAWAPFSPRIMELRNVLRHRHTLVKSRTRHKNQLHALTSGQYGNRQVANSLKKLIRQLDREIEAIEREARAVYRGDEVLVRTIQPIVDSLPGAGWLSVLTIYAETNGFATINSRRQLSRYAGLNVVENQSGRSRRKTRISKQGNSRIRTILYMCAIAVVKSKTGPLYRKYLRIVARNPKARKVGITALQRSILELVYTLHRTGKPYDPEHVWGSDRPQANHPSTAKKVPPSGGPEVHGIAHSEESLPRSSPKIKSMPKTLVS